MSSILDFECVRCFMSAGNKDWHSLAQDSTMRVHCQIWIIVIFGEMSQTRPLQSVASPLYELC